MPTVTAACTCGHMPNLHTNTTGACTATGCGCPAFIELCPVCKHSKDVHDDGVCTRVKLVDRTVCGCSYYPVPGS